MYPEKTSAYTVTMPMVRLLVNLRLIGSNCSDSMFFSMSISLFKRSWYRELQSDAKDFWRCIWNDFMRVIAYVIVLWR